MKQSLLQHTHTIVELTTTTCSSACTRGGFGGCLWEGGLAGLGLLCEERLKSERQGNGKMASNETVVQHTYVVVYKLFLKLLQRDAPTFAVAAVELGFLSHS